MPHSTFIRAAALWFVVSGLSGCTLATTRYSVAVSNTLALREAGLPALRVGDIRKDPAARPDVERLRTRGTSLTSPYGSFTAYLREALANELEHADLLDANSPTAIDGILLVNDYGSSPERDHLDMAARFTVMREGKVLYEGTPRIRYEWDAPFAGAVAIPRSAANYRTGVQRLVAALIDDPAFLEALRAR